MQLVRPRTHVRGKRSPTSAPTTRSTPSVPHDDCTDHIVVCGYTAMFQIQRLAYQVKADYEVKATEVGHERRAVRAAPVWTNR